MKHKIICGDCLKVVHSIETNSVDLIILDSPYNINKAEWDKIPNYVDWMGTVFLECQRVLKDNGSFYFFHNDFLQLVKLQQWIGDNTEFVFKQLIVWNKRFEKANNKGYLDGFVEVNGLRNYQQMAEYISYYTFHGDNENNKLYLVAVSEIQRYVKDLIYKYTGNVTKANEFYCNWSGNVGNYRGFFFGKSQPVLYTEQQYKGLCLYIRSLGCKDKLKSYNNILEMFDKQAYQNLRYTFNNQKTHHSVWNYEIEQKQGHTTQKPVALIENIIRHSSNEGDIVLDPMCGSGTTLIAAERLKRNSIGIEISKEYCKLSYQRLLKEVQQQKWNQELSTIEKIGF